MTCELYYLADPMCSWCWGFAPLLERVEGGLRADVRLRYVMGGLAPDSDEPMPEATRAMVQAAWDAVEQATGARFERAFWERCVPRRSTWPACRAVLAAERSQVGAGPALFRALQRAYYREARNPSEVDTLVAVAEEQGHAGAAFRRLLDSDEVAADLARDLALKSRLGVSGFPSLVAAQPGGARLISRGWQPWEELKPRLRAAGLLA